MVHIPLFIKACAGRILTRYKQGSNRINSMCNLNILPAGPLHLCGNYPNILIGNSPDIIVEADIFVDI